MLNDISKICLTNQKLLFAVLICIAIDTVLGVTKAITNKEFTFTSNGLRKGLPKIIEYCCALILGLTFELVTNKPITCLFAVSIIITECISIKENLSSIPIAVKLINWFINAVSNEYNIEDDDVTGDTED